MENPAAPGSVPRDPALDALRASMMGLGIVLHAAMLYLAAPPPVMAFPTDPHASLVMDAVVHWVHNFRMPLFFLLSGWFSAQMLARRGLRETLRHRARRIGLPLLLGCFTVLPLAAKHGLEKIKTIGDAYMAVAGLPHAQPDHAVRAARMALDMVEAVAQRAARTGEALQIRVGLHSGPVVAGVIGQSKFSYDLWGDTVNLASRLESHGEPGRVHCSAATAELLDGHMPMQSRGPIEIKGKGSLPTYFVSPSAAA